jgi:hypothetical protein
MRKTYSELLLDPRWQKKRLQILEAAEWRCAHCEDSEKTLHVHHLLYRKGAKPWEYEDRELIVLCADCHKSDHRLRDEIADGLARSGSICFPQIIGYLTGLRIISEFDDYKGKDFEEVIEMGGDYGTGVIDALGLNFGPYTWYDYQVRQQAWTLREIINHYEMANQRRKQIVDARRADAGVWA